MTVLEMPVLATEKKSYLDLNLVSVVGAIEYEKNSKVLRVYPDPSDNFYFYRINNADISHLRELGYESNSDETIIIAEVWLKENIEVYEVDDLKCRVNIANLRDLQERRPKGKKLLKNGKTGIRDIEKNFFHDEGVCNVQGEQMNWKATTFSEEDLGIGELKELIVSIFDHGKDRLHIIANFRNIGDFAGDQFKVGTKCKIHFSFYAQGHLVELIEENWWLPSNAERSLSKSLSSFGIDFLFDEIDCVDLHFECEPIYRANLLPKERR